MGKASGRNRTARARARNGSSALSKLVASRRVRVGAAVAAGVAVLAVTAWFAWAWLGGRTVDYAQRMRTSPARKAYEVGLVATQSGRTSEAEEAFQRAIGLDGSNALPYNALASLYLNNQDVQKAIVTAENGVNAAPGSPDLLYTLGVSRYKAGRFADAEQALRQSVDLNPDAPEAHLWLGNTCLVLSKLGGADASGDPTKLGDAIEAFRAAVKLEPETAAYHAALAEGLYQRRDLAEARAALEEAVRLDPKTPSYFTSLGRICDELDDPDAAVAAFTKATEGDVYDAEAFAGLGTAYFKKGMDPEAADAFRKAIKVNPFHVAAHEKLAQVLMRTGQNDEGQKEMAAADESRERAKTLDGMKRASASDPTNAELANNLGIELARQGDFEDAMLSFQRAISANPRFLDPKYQMAGVFAKRGKVLEAIKAFEDVDKAQPGYRRTNYYLAQLYGRIGRKSEADRRQHAWDAQVKAGPVSDS